MRNTLGYTHRKRESFTLVAAATVTLSFLALPASAATHSPTLTVTPAATHAISEPQRVAKAQKATTTWLMKMSDSKQKTACMKFSTDPSGPFMKKRIFRNAKKYRISKQAAFAPTVKAFNMVCLTRFS